MKTTLILLTIIFTAAWAGCSDNLNVTDPLEGQNSIAKNQLRPTVNEKDPTVDEQDPTIDQRKPATDLTKPATDLRDPATNLGNIELLWSLDELSVKATSENETEDKAVYDNPAGPTSPNEYLITFEVSSNANWSTNGYSPYVSVSKDDETMYSGSDFFSGGEVWAHKELRFRNGTFSQIAFYIALFQIDNKSVGDGTVDPVRLTLKDIKIFRVK
jgi:hypothetical protein